MSDYNAFTPEGGLSVDALGQMVFDGQILTKPVGKAHNVDSADGKTVGDVIEYDLMNDKNGEVSGTVFVFIPRARVIDNAAGANNAGGQGSAGDIGKITEIQWMALDDGKPVKMSQRGDPHLTIASLNGVSIDQDTFLTKYSDDDSFNRYPYIVSLLNGNTKVHDGSSSNRNLEVGQGGKAVVDSGGGDDTLHVWHHKSVVFDGGKGSDTLDFGQAFGRLETEPTIGATADLGKGTGSNPWGGNIKLTSVENVIGYYGAANTLIGSNEANQITAGGYGDTLKGLGGNDTITVGAYFGIASGEPRNLHADGGKGTDILAFDGFFGETQTLDLEHQDQNTGTFADGIFKNFEAYKGDGAVGSFIFRGSEGNDKVLANQFSSASDDLDGRGGNDTLNGAGGADTLTGGAGADTFKFTFAFDSVPGAADTITDFSHAEHDKIDLSQVSFGGKFKFIGTKAFDGHMGEVHVSTQGSQTVVDVDTNGDKTADVEILLDHHPKLSAHDFML